MPFKSQNAKNCSASLVSQINHIISPIMALLSPYQQQQRARKIFTFLIAATISPFIVGQIIGAFFVFIFFFTIISKSSTVFKDLGILILGILAHLGILYFFISNEYLTFDKMNMFIFAATQFIPSYITIHLLSKRGLIFES
jgi:hypothetical protein